uniref:ZP domain-containing protein n=1 Tax=Heliothis virescens TaxID=7102 RepID=A0A2A4JNN2_HELVI
MRVNTLVFLLVSQAVNVAVCSREYGYKNNAGVSEHRHRFYHGRNDTLHMDIWLNNIQPGVSVGIDIDSVSPERVLPVPVVPYLQNARQQYYVIKMALLSETATYVYVRMCIEGSCIRKTLAEGIAGRPRSSVKDACLRELPCTVVVDMKDEPIEELRSIVMPTLYQASVRPRPRPTKGGRTQVRRVDHKFKTPRYPKQRKPLPGAPDTWRPHPPSSSNELTTLRYPEQIETLTSAPDNLRLPKNTVSDATTVIISVVCTAGLIMLVVGARKVCKCDAGIYQPRINYLTNRFYVNLLFRKECDAEIREIEQHKYEEIEQHYEEIK